MVLRRQAGFDAARQIELFAAISRDDPSNEKWSLQEIAAVLRIAPATAATHVHRAELLTTTLRKTLAALRAGDITARHAELLASAVMSLDRGRGPRGGGTSPRRGLRADRQPSSAPQ